MRLPIIAIGEDLLIRVTNAAGNHLIEGGPHVRTKRRNILFLCGKYCPCHTTRAPVNDVFHILEFLLATVINGIAIQGILEKFGMFTRLVSAIHMNAIAEPFIRRRAIRHLEKGRIVIFGAGTGNPYFTTDSAGSLRAIEISADVVLKGTRVDGVYSADPEKDPTATKFTELSFDEAIAKNLKIMDMTAFTLCKENKLPIIVFDMNKPGNLLKLVMGEQIGTLIK